MKYKFDPILGAGRDAEVLASEVVGLDAALAGKLGANVDALADLLEAAPTADPASLARIQASVSEAGAINAALTVNTSRNIFDFRKATDGYYLDSAGNLAVTPLNGFSALIPVTVGQQYVGSHGGVAGNHIRMHCFYAANGVTVVPGGSSSAVSTFTAPAGAVFVRVTYNITSQLNKQQFQLEAGSVATNLTTPDNGLTGSVVVPDESVPAISRSRNLFDPGAAVDGVYIDQNNNVAANAALGSSGYIPVEPGAIYRASDWVGVGNGMVSDNNVLRFSTFYDANKNWVAGGSGVSTRQINVPAGVYFVRVTYNISTANGMTTGKDSLQIERCGPSIASTSYVPFNRAFAKPDQSATRVPNGSTWGLERLRRWRAWKLSPSGNLDIVLHGDSWVDGNYWAKLFKSKLLAQGGYTDGGPGWLQFFGLDTGMSPPLDAAQFSASWTTGAWTPVTAASSWGPSCTHITSTASGNTITIAAGTALASVKLIYKKQVGGGSFTWAINGGSTTTVSTANVNTAISSTTIDTSGAGASFTVTLTALGAGIEFAGCVARKSGSTLLTIHKAGLTGSQAAQWGKNYLYPQAMTEMLGTSKAMFVYPWGVNDINANIQPSQFRGHIQNIVGQDRAIDPMADLIFLAPPQQTYGTEVAKTYVAADYTAAMYQLAQANDGAAFVSLDAIFGKFTQASVDAGFFHADRVHPGERGGPLVASTLAAALL